MRWRPFPIVGGSYADDTKPWSVQDTVNYLPVSAERSGTRSASMLKSAPGFTTFCDLGTGLPIRGAHNAEGLFLVVSGNTLFSVSPKGVATSLGTIPGVGRVSMAHNQVTGGNQVAIANGLGGYVYDTTKSTLTQITDEGFVGAIDFAYVDSYIVGVEPGKRFWFTSDLADATSYNTLDRYEAEGSPDKIMGLIVTHREVWVMGERTIEPFQNTGAAEGTFQRAAGMVMERGLASTFAMALLDNSVFWLGDDGVVYRANGYQPVRISTFPIEQAISRCNMSLAFAFTFEEQGHKVFYLTFPDGQTWGFDVASGEWHRRQSYGMSRWRLNTLTNWNGGWYGGDFTNGKIYRLDWDSSSESFWPLERRRVCGVFHDNQNRVVIDAIALVIDTGLDKAASHNLGIYGSLGDYTIGSEISFFYTISADSDYKVSVAAGALPPALTIDAHGFVSGTLESAGSFSWVLKVEDEYGNSKELSDQCTIDIDPTAASILAKAVLWAEMDEAAGVVAKEEVAGNNGTYNGVTNYQAVDPFGTATAKQFGTANNACLVFPSTPELQLSSKMSIGFWVKRKYNGYIDETLYNRGVSVSTVNIYPEDDNGVDNITVSYNGNINKRQAGALDGAWHFVIINMSSSTPEASMFIDGVQVGTSYTGSSMPAATSPNEFFGSPRQSKGFGKASSDAAVKKCMIFNGILTSDEVSWLYNDGKGRTYAQIREYGS